MSETVVDRVRHVVDAAAMSKVAFSERIRLTPDKLSKALGGTRRFTSLELALIAEVGGVTVDWLLTGRQPVRPAIAARALAADVLPEPVSLETVTGPVSQAYEVLGLLGRSPDLPSMPELRDLPRYIDQGEALAADALTWLRAKGVAALATLDSEAMMTALEDVFGIDIGIASLPTGLSGLAWQTDAFRLVLLSPTEVWTRQRFTLAHELGHILARDAQQLIPERQMTPGRRQDRTESRANAFAAALLMPSEDVVEAIRTALADEGVGSLSEARFADLVVRFRVSPSALLARLGKLRLVDSETQGRLRGLTTEFCHLVAGGIEADQREKSLTSVRRRVPPRPAMSLFSAYCDGDTTLRPFAALLDRDVDELHELLDRAERDLSVQSSDEGDPVYQP
jgi:IrrE N-terminal-like domain